jgi:hypothetical protein
MATGTKTSGLLPRHVIVKMAVRANCAIDKALLVGSPTMISQPRTEVGFVVAVTLRSIWDIAAAWTPLCSRLGLRLDLAGVFCHAAPLVQFTDARRELRHCELADLLLVVDIGDTGSFTRRAALVQAKMARAAGRVSLSGASSRVQLDLYQKWHKFDFEESIYGLSQVDFTNGGGAIDSGTIGVIDRHFITPPVWTQHAANPTPAIISGEPQLGEFIAEMVDGTRSGFGRLATPALQTDWSKTVERLLDVTYNRVFHHKPTLGPTGVPRGVRAVASLNFTQMANLTSGNPGGSIKGPPDDFEIREDDRVPRGISVVHVGIGPIQED